MKKQSKMLKVVSILLIIFGALGAISTAGSVLLLQSVMESPEMQAAFEAAGTAQPTMGMYAVSILTSVVELVAGIVGVMYRSRKSVLIAAAVWIVFIVIGLIQSIALTGFGGAIIFSLILSLILPVLYLWGWYQSN